MTIHQFYKFVQYSFDKKERKKQTEQNKQAYMLLCCSETWNMLTGWVALLSNPTKCT